jgi:1-aminocyclopropane-1-carboxylate deaminase/D-cysteine desulfhydrase-like pyridoxal-dependent ACC family enzyme
MDSRLTPIERHGHIWLKRDDLYTAGGAHGGKARACWALAQGAPGLVTACSRISPQGAIVASIARALGIPAVVHTASGPYTDEMRVAEAAGAIIVQHRPGYTTVTRCRARADAEKRGWKCIPFGMECEEAVEETRRQVQNLSTGVQRIVIPLGSGMSAAGVLWGLYDTGQDIPVLGVLVGGDPTKRLDRYAPPMWRFQMRVERAPGMYTRGVDFSVDGVRFDPHYEAKCGSFLRNGDLLWIVGNREIADASEPEGTTGAANGG